MLVGGIVLSREICEALDGNDLELSGSKITSSESLRSIL